jgi:hypothetical protein
MIRAKVTGSKIAKDTGRTSETPRPLYQDLARADKKRRGLASNIAATIAPPSRQGDRANSKDDPEDGLKSIAEAIKGIAQNMDLDAYSIEAFCARHSISVPLYYKLRKDGLTPREMSAGARVLITKESAAEWRRDGVAASAKKREHESANVSN